ncbi:Protein of unknown function [Prosthecobacter debontii]|uniref:Tat (Twin-arginine translocation) pathway signal sequence n=2 Tax=Prosthecobacter debontii TaxID=48467 RepID=A0A1T4XSJ5_9BACT|nr:Protein of unknown function [Prosthecobacter debontii]
MNMNASSSLRCELDRRRFMTGAAKSLLGVGLLPAGEHFFSGKALAAGQGAATARQVPTARSVIYLYMTGGQSHLDTWDPKPENKEVMGATKTIKTSADGVLIGEYLPRMATQMHHACVINSVATNTGAHEQANYYMHTSFGLRGTIKHPGMGAWLSFYQGAGNPSLPPYVYIGNDSRHPGAGFFPKKHGPLMVNNPEAGLQNVRPPKGVSEDRFAMRRDLASAMDVEFQAEWATRGVKAYADMYDDAVRLMKSDDLRAFDLTQESDAVRQAYGKETFGQGCLLARRLVEHGVRFIEVSLGSWDTHTANFINTPRLCDVLDIALSALVADLQARGLLESTMIVVSSEFGRTPKINQNQGRDHYPVFSSVLIGGGIQGGQKYGATDKDGAQVVADKVSPPDLNATIGYALGLPLDQVIYSPTKRPFTVADKGQPLTQLFG